MDTINIEPGTPDGAIVAQSEDISKIITCSGAPSNTLIASLIEPVKDLSTISIIIPDKKIYNKDDGSCQVMNSGYPGLGIAWYNYNSGTNVWHCYSDGTQHGRGLNSNGNVSIIDVIYLVKTGTISPGTFDFNQTFNINETGIKAGYIPDYGLLYQITLSGNTTILAPSCDISVENGDRRYTFSIDDAIDGSYSTEDWLVNISCEGYIPNGDILPFEVISDDGVFTLNENYFGSSDRGLGVSIKYKTDNASNQKTLIPTERILVPINDNKGSFGLKFTPFALSTGGEYPLVDMTNFKIKIINNK